MSCVQNHLFTTQPNPLNRTITGALYLAALTAVALSVIGLTASQGGAFKTIVQFGATNHGLVLGASSLILILNSLWMASLHEKKKEPMHLSQPSPLEKPELRHTFKVMDEEVEVSHKDEPSFMELLPEEIIFHIFSYLSAQDLAHCHPVSRQWNSIANDEFFWAKRILRQAFGKESWAPFGDIGEEPPLPSNICEILSAPCPFWSGQRVGETHFLMLIPAKINREQVTLNELVDLARKPTNGYKLDYLDYERDHITKLFLHAPIKKSYWLLMTKHIIPTLFACGYNKQEKRIKKHEGYSFPKIIEVISSFLLHITFPKIDTITEDRVTGNGNNRIRIRVALDKELSTYIGALSAPPNHYPGSHADALAVRRFQNG